MAGILNNKERMIDFIITEQGRRQMADGRMRIEYASFTDMHTFYQASGSLLPDVAEDATNRVFFEATDRHQDIIVPELDAGFAMQPFRAGDFKIEGRDIASGTFKLGPSGEKTFQNVLSGSEINEVSTALLSSIATNFKDQRILRTEDLFSDTTDFRLTAHTASFAITNTQTDFGDVFQNGNQFSTVIPRFGQEANLNSMPNIFGDVRFSHLPNFRYLPPVNTSRQGETPTPIGIYPYIGPQNVMEKIKGGGSFFGQESQGISISEAEQLRELDLSELEAHLEHLQNLEFGFADTSRDNNIVAQIFDLNTPNNEEGHVEKLSIIDYGEFPDNDPESPGKHIYFVGKIRPDENGCQTFMNIFTIVID